MNSSRPLEDFYNKKIQIYMDDNQSEDIKRFTEELQSFVSSAKRDSADIQKLLGSISTKAEDVDLYYGTFSELKTKLGDGQTGLQALFDQSTNLKTKIQQLTDAAQAQLGEITTRADSVTTKVKEIEDYYTATFLPLKAKVDDEKTGLQAILGVAVGLKDEIVKTKAGTDENYRQIKNLTDQSDKLKQQSELSHKEIEALKKKSEDFKSEIAKTFYIVTDTSLANSFKERKDEIKKEMDKWLKYLNWSTGILAITVIGIYISQYFGNTNIGEWRFWYRFAFTSPIIFFVFFASHNYNKERDLLEKYAFKFAVSLSLQSYTKLLTDTFTAEKYKDELIKFSVKSIESVYKEPYTDKDETKELYGGFRNVFNFGLKNNTSKSRDDQKEKVGQKDNVPKI